MDEKAISVVALVVIVAIVAGVVGVGVYFAARAPAPPGVGEFSLSTTSGHVGDSVTLTGTEFEAGATISIEYDGTGIKTVTADEEGEFEVSITIPERVLGDHILTTKPASITAKFTVIKFPWENMKIGYAVHMTTGDWHLMDMTYFEWFAHDRGHETFITNCRHDEVTQLKQIKHMVEDVGIDVLLWVPPSVEGTVRIAEYLHEKGILNITSQNTSNSPYIDLFSGFSVVAFAEKSTEAAVEFLKDKYGEPKGWILEMQGGLDVSWGIDLHQGVLNVTDEYPDITVRTYTCDWDPAKAIDRAYNAMQKYGKPDVIFGAGWGALCNSCYEALTKVTGEENPPWWEEGHVFICGSDAEWILDKIKEGRADQCFTQNEPYSPTIPIYFFEQVYKYEYEEGVSLEEAKEAVLPKPGTVLRREDLVNTIGELGGIHFGLDPWATPAWSPVKITEVYGHPKMGFEGGMVALENSPYIEADMGPEDSSIWSNMLTFIREHGFKD